MGLSWSHILVVLVLFLLLFGRGKVSELMGDVAKGIKSFKQGMADDDEPQKTKSEPAPEPKVIEHKSTASSPRKSKPAAKAKSTRSKST